MAFQTTNYFIQPEDGWVLVATDPTFVLVRAGIAWPWKLVITESGTPADMVLAAGTITFSGVVSPDDTLTVGDITYTYVDIADGVPVLSTLAAIRDQMVIAIDGDGNVAVAAGSGASLVIGPEISAPTTFETDSDALTLTWSAVVTFSGLPTAGQTITVGTNAYEYVAEAPGAGEIQIGGNATAARDNTLAAIVADAEVVAVAGLGNTIAVSGLAGPESALVALSETATNVVVAWNGVITVTDFPEVSDTFDVDSDTYTFVTGWAEPYIQVGATAGATRDATIGALAGNPKLSGATLDGADAIDLVSGVGGTGGNSVILAKDSSDIAVSGAALEGGVNEVTGLVFKPEAQPDGWEFRLAGSEPMTAEVYIRAARPIGRQEPMPFAVITDTEE